MFDFEELDDTTRQYMLSEFRVEESSGNPYRSDLLTQSGLEAFPGLMEEAIRSGNEEPLARALSTPAYWHPFQIRFRRGKPYQAKVDPVKAAERLAFTEFNTWYVRGLAKRLLEEGIGECQVYRAAPARQPRSECRQHKGAIYDVQLVYDGHRARYWPPPGNREALSIQQ